MMVGNWAVPKPRPTALASRRTGHRPGDTKGRLSMERRALLGGIAAASGLLAAPHVVRAQTPITLNGASQFNEEHVFTRAMKHFAVSLGPWSKT